MDFSKKIKKIRLKLITESFDYQILKESFKGTKTNRNGVTRSLYNKGTYFMVGRVWNWSCVVINKEQCVIILSNTCENIHIGPNNKNSGSEETDGL